MTYCHPMTVTLKLFLTNVFDISCISERQSDKNQPFQCQRPTDMTVHKLKFGQSLAINNALANFYKHFTSVLITVTLR